VSRIASVACVKGVDAICRPLGAALLPLIKFHPSPVLRPGSVDPPAKILRNRLLSFPVLPEVVAAGVVEADCNVEETCRFTTTVSELMPLEGVSFGTGLADGRSPVGIGLAVLS